MTRNRTRWTSAIVIACLLVAANIAHSGGISDDCDERALAAKAFRKAVNLRGDGHTGEALLELDKAVALDPEEVTYRIARGELNLLVRRYTMAVQDYEIWVRLEPLSAQAQGDLGKALSMARNHESAIEAFSRAIKLGGTDIADFYYRRGSNYQQMNRLWAALLDYQEAFERLRSGAIQEHPWNYMIYRNLSELYFRLGYIRNAIESYDTGAQIISDTSGSYPFGEGVRADTPVQIGKPIPEFLLESAQGGSVTSRELIGQTYVLFRWEPALLPTTLYDWPFGPMDALVLEDDTSIMLDVFEEIYALGVKLVSVTTRPLGIDPEGQILRQRRRNWALFELPRDDQTWVGRYDHGRDFRILIVDAAGTIRLALLTKDAREIKETVLPLLEQLSKEQSDKSKVTNVRQARRPKKLASAGRRGAPL